MKPHCALCTLLTVLGHCSALAAPGDKRWEFTTGSYVSSSPAIGADGTVYVGSDDHRFYALDGATGAKRWEFDNRSQSYRSPVNGLNAAIGADGTVYFGFDNGKVYALFGSSPLADSPWPMFGNNPRHTGRVLPEQPTILQPPIDVVAAAGANVGFTTVAEARGALRFQWRFNGEQIAGAEGPNLSLEAVSQANVGSYDVVISNDKGSVTSPAAMLTLASGNQAPTFIKGSDQVVNEDAGDRSVVGWATSITAGPANESDQALTFLVTNDNHPLFATQPMISAEGTLTYTPAANAHGTATVNVVLKDDGGVANGGADTSATQTFVILVNPVNDSPTFTRGADQVVNEDAGGQSVVSWAAGLTAGPANESDQALTFLVTNDNPPLFATQPAISAEGTLTYTPAANAHGAATVNVVLKDDGGIANGGSYTSVAQTFAILVNPANDSPTFTKGADQSINKDAGAQTVAGWATVISAGPTNESSQTLTFLVTNDNHLLFATQPAISAEGALTYAPSPNAHGTATVNVVLKDNGGIANGGSDTSVSQTFVILVNPVNESPTFTKGANQSINEDAGAQSVAGWATVISAGPTNESSQALTFLVTNDNQPLFATQPAISAEGTLDYTPAPNAHGTATVSVVLKDDGGIANGGSDTSVAQTFVILINPVNDSPTFTKGADQSINEDAGAQSVADWATIISAGSTNESSQTLTFLVTNDNQPLFASQPAISAEGVLTYAPAINAHGTAMVNVVLKDDGGIANGGSNTSVAQTFVILINPVNDSPTFTKGADQSINEDAGAQSVAGWATVISAGPTNESSQKLTFLVTNDNQPLFATQPAISAEGALTYAPAANAHGTATVTVVLKDDGGIANGGTDTSNVQTFVIEVLRSEPLRISGISQEQGQLEIRWEGNHILQWAADLTGPWLDLPEARSPFTVISEGNKRFYRLRSKP